ncbi:MAG: DUF3419 family protein [Phycisphaerales bacterium]
MTTAITDRSKDLLHGAVRHARPLSKQGVQERLFAAWFNGLVYNQIWEDPRVDAAALQLGPHSRVLTISSAGCNALAYLAYGPQSVVSVDLNHHHLALARLKIGAVRSLPGHTELFDFFGCADDPRNVERFDRHIAPGLDADTLAYWNHRTGGALLGDANARRVGWFTTGFYKRSRLGRLLGLIHKSLRAIGRDPHDLVRATRTSERERLFDEAFAPFFDLALIRWIGSSPLSVFSLGIPPSQHRAMHHEASGQLLAEYRRRTRRLFCAWPIEDNCFAWQAATRGYDRRGGQVAGVPDYLRPADTDLIRSRLDRLETRLTSTIDALEGAAPGDFNALVFLDSQDWMPPAVIERQWRAIARVAPPGSRIIFRTAAAASPIEPSLPADLMARFVYHEQESRRFYNDDRSAIYGGFHLYSVR